MKWKESREGERQERGRKRTEGKGFFLSVRVCLNDLFKREKNPSAVRDEGQRVPPEIQDRGEQWLHQDTAASVLQRL